MKDNRAIVHIAGSGWGHEQRCIRCSARLNNAMYSDSRWGEGSLVANHGHGGWSRLEHGITDPTKYRYCESREDRDFRRAFTENKYGELA